MAVTAIWAVKSRVDKALNYVMNPEKTKEKPELSKAAIEARKAVGDVIDYAVNPEKTEQMMYVRDIFWAMNSVAYTTETVTETVLVPDLDSDGNQKTDADGNLLYVEQTTSKTILHITISHLSAAEEAYNLCFNDEQMAELSELLDVKNASLWAQVLRGVGLGSNELVNLALSQLGNEGGEKFWRWAGLDSRCAWCALFVSWCADQTGLRASGQIPYFSFVGDGISWFKEKDKWIDGSEVNSSNYDKIVYPGMGWNPCCSLRSVPQE